MQRKASDSSIIDLIGNTPIIKVQKMDTGPCELFLKLENSNPGGSIKDRIVLNMIEAAEKTGKLKPGATIVEATAGNTGIALALIAAMKDYRLVLVIPDKMSQEKILQVKAMGAEVMITRSDVDAHHPENYMNKARQIADETPNSLFINQFDNPANPASHEKTTGPEIWQQMDQDLDAVVCGVGSGGTITGLGRYFANISPKTEMILADPQGSCLAAIVNGEDICEPGKWLVEGIGQDHPPGNFNPSLIKRGYSIPDRESITACHELLAKEGVLCGSSTGTLLATALRYCREQKEKKRVLTFVCDGGGKYLSKIFNPDWLKQVGL